jgi:hypothetical protein
LAEDTYRKRNVLLIGVLEQAWNESGARFVIRELLRVFWNNLVELNVMLIHVRSYVFIIKDHRLVLHRIPTDQPLERQ